jgi:hypothetical protein
VIEIQEAKCVHCGKFIGRVPVHGPKRDIYREWHWKWLHRETEAAECVGVVASPNPKERG